MNPESAKCFSYNHAYLVKNDVLLEKFNFSYVEKKKKGYKPEELEESFGFLLCEQENQVQFKYRNKACFSEDISVLYPNPFQFCFQGKTAL
ncbi:UNVERIFIED_CONTAM: hypothetical protein FKN15_021739 [Acipenser sinensis]